MNRKVIYFIGVFALIFAMISLPQFQVHAQCGLASPCPPDNDDKKTATSIPPTFTFTPSPTATPTNTFTPTATETPTATNTSIPTFTPTATITPSPTPIPPMNIVLPGAGIGALILFLIVGVVFPIVQKIRVTKRGY